MKFNIKKKITSKNVWRTTWIDTIFFLAMFFVYRMDYLPKDIALLFLLTTTISLLTDYPLLYLLTRKEDTFNDKSSHSVNQKFKFNEFIKVIKIKHQLKKVNKDVDKLTKLIRNSPNDVLSIVKFQKAETRNLFANVELKKDVSVNRKNVIKK